MFQCLGFAKLAFKKQERKKIKNKKVQRIIEAKNTRKDRKKDRKKSWKRRKRHCSLANRNASPTST